MGMVELSLAGASVSSHWSRLLHLQKSGPKVRASATVMSFNDTKLPPTSPPQHAVQAERSEVASVGLALGGDLELVLDFDALDPVLIV